jgi:hypothetical protein
MIPNAMAQFASAWETFWATVLAIIASLIPQLEALFGQLGF